MVRTRMNIVKSSPQSTTHTKKSSNSSTCCTNVQIKKRYKSRGIVSGIAAASALTLNSSIISASAFVPTCITSTSAVSSLTVGKTYSKYFARKKSTLKEEPDAASESTATHIKTEKVEVERTQSFAPQTNADKSISVHTLVLGTHPSIASLAKERYFGHPQNAFWWIAGDCLGFRRSAGISPSTGKPYKLTEYLLEGEDKVIPYEEQMEVFTSKGFALWDIVQSCERKGSLDNDIKDEVPNKIRAFCDEHGTIQRIIMANGAKQCSFFNKYFGQWWLDGELKPGTNERSQKAFKKWINKKNVPDTKVERQIEVYCMPGVSPAAASVSYEKKRKEYQRYCYGPGLVDHERLKSL